MTPPLRGAFISAIVALAAGVGGVWIGTALFGCRVHHATLHQVVHQELNLTADQERRVAALESSFAAERQALEMDMRAANAALAAAIQDEHGYGPRVTAAVERFHNAMGRLQTETIRHVFAMREILTPEQRPAFDHRIASALTTDAQ